MCGFTVFYNHKNFNKKKNIDKFFSFIDSRGPDKQIKKIQNKITFLFTRLSIQDLSKNGDQPIYSLSKNFLMVFNGEIYNHLKLRSKINKIYPKIKWKGSSDSETLVECFDKFGIQKTIKELSGMYSIFLLDIKKNEFYLINDIFGEKPIYYEILKNNFIVSSSLKSFTLKKNQLDIEGISNLFVRNYIPHNQTSLMNIKKIEPGTIIKYKIQKNKIIKIQKKKYYQIKKPNKYFTNESFESLSNSLEKTLLEAVEEQLISDVPVGSFLSGGIDSTLVTALMNKVSKNKISTFTIGFKSDKFNEAKYAKEIAKFLNTNHNEKYLTSDNLISIFDEVVNAYSEPFSDSSQLPTTLLCKFASSKIKVCLTGDGGDELFGGYNRYIFNPKLWKIFYLIPKPIKSQIYKFSKNQNNFFYNLFTLALKIYDKRFKNMPYLNQKINSVLKSINSNSLGELTLNLSSHINFDELNYLISKNIKFKSNLDLVSDTEDLMFHDLKTYLPSDLLVKVDRASMNYGLETRMPFLNKKVYEFSRKLPLKYKINKNDSKIILKNILYKYVPKKLVDRPKQGFLIPINELLKSKKIIKLIDNTLNNKKISDQNVFNANEIDRIWQKYKNGYIYDQYLIWDIIMFQSWIDTNVSNISISQ